MLNTLIGEGEQQGPGFQEPQQPHHPPPMRQQGPMSGTSLREPGPGQGPPIRFHGPQSVPPRMSTGSGGFYQQQYRPPPRPTAPKHKPLPGKHGTAFVLILISSLFIKTVQLLILINSE